MPVGFIRRLARQSLSNANIPALADNWTTQQTTTYVPATPAVSPGVWGGTVADLDRVFTATGSGYTVKGALLTFVHKPETNSLGQKGSLSGVIVKIQPTFIPNSRPAIELWSLKGATWTKRRRVALGGLVRTGEMVVLDLTGPTFSTDDVDAYWVTLAPDDAGDTVSWLALHVYGICPNDPVTPDCPPGTPPADCGGPECGVDVASWVCLDPPVEPTAPTVPFVLPPILVKVQFPPARLGCGVPNQPPFNILRMFFGELPGGGSVTVRVVNGQGIIFAEGVTQTIAAAGNMDWTVLTGFFFSPAPAQVFPTANAWPIGLGPLYPRVDTSSMVFEFTRKLDGTLFSVAGNLLDILMYAWTTGFACTVVC